MNKVAVAVTPNAVVIAAPIAAEASDVAQEPPSGRSTRKATQLKRIVGAADGTPANASLGGLPLPRVQPLDLTKKRKFDAAPSRGAAPTRKQRRLAFVCNMRPQNAQTQGPDDEFEEFDSPATIQALANLFGREGYIVSILEADRTLPRRLANGHFDLVFNMAEGKGGRCREALVPALCELLGLAYTGSDPLTFAATLDKAVAKRLIASEVATPRWLLARNIADLAQFDLAFPVFAKPNDEGSSKGIGDDSKCSNFSELESRVAHLLECYGRPVLIEEFVRGSEVTVSIIGNKCPEVIGLMQVIPTGGEGQDFVYSLQCKRDYQNRVRYAIPPELPADTCARVAEAALKCYRLLDCRDVSRVDFRVSADGTPHFIECNPLPGLSPISGDLVLTARAMGWSWDQLVSRIVHEAEFRQGVLRPVLVGERARPPRSKPQPRLALPQSLPRAKQ